MSGLYTYERFAIVEVAGGLHVDTFSSLEQLAKEAVFRFGFRWEDGEVRTTAEHAAWIRSLADEFEAEAARRELPDADAEGEDGPEEESGD